MTCSLIAPDLNISVPAAKPRVRAAIPLQNMPGVRIISPNDDDTEISTLDKDFRLLQKMRLSDQEDNRGARDPNNIGAEVIPVTEGLDDEPIETALAVDTAHLLPEDSIGMAYPVFDEDWVPIVGVAVSDPQANMREEALKRRLITPLEAGILEADARINKSVDEDRSRVLESRMKRAVRDKKIWKDRSASMAPFERLFCVIADAMRYNILSELVSADACTDMTTET